MAGKEGGRIRGHRFWIGIAYFLFAAAPGCWFPTIARTLVETGWGDLVRPVFLIMPLAGLVSPLLFAALADQKFNAERVLAWTVGGGSVFLWLAFEALGAGQSRAMFMVWMVANMLISAPAWALLNAVALTHLPGERFGSYRACATLGWALAGVLVSFLGADASALSGKMAVGIRLLACVACLLLPLTVPRGGGMRGWRDALGLGALGILKDRQIAVYFGAAFLLAVPMVSHYMHTPIHLGELGVERTAAWMAVCQATEVVALVMMGYLIVRWSLRGIFVLAMVCALGRFVLNMVGAQTGNIFPIMVGLGLAGVAWAFFFEAGRVFVDRRVEVGLRAQAQALLGLGTMSLGAVVGTFVVQALWQAMVGEDGNGVGGWVAYWGALSVLAALALGVFVVLGGRLIEDDRSRSPRERPR